jgi:hypothetical protein
MFEELLDRLRDIRETPLTTVTMAKLVAALVVVGLLFLIEATSQEGWVPLLDSLNLVFHESGHPLFSIFGETIGFMGGTLMQLIIPLVVLGACWGKRQTVAIGLAGVWFFQNFLNIARYMADARAQELPLVGGGEHDWATLFGQWGLLARDTAIAGVVKALGWIGMVVCLGWIAWRWYHDRELPAARNTA